MRWWLGILLLVGIIFLMKDLASWSLSEPEESIATSEPQIKSESFEALADGRLREILFSEPSRPEINDEDLKRLVEVWKGGDSSSSEETNRVDSIALTERSLESIQLELQSMPRGKSFAAKRSMLLNAAAQMETDDEDALDQVHELALRELFANPEESLSEEISDESKSLDSFNHLLPMVAYEVALKTAVDIEEALALTLESLSTYQDPSVQSAFIQQFNRYFPEEQFRLADKMAERNSTMQGF